MTLLSKNVAMKPKAADSQCEPVFSKQNVKMAINRTLATKKAPEGGLDSYPRGTVLVNNVGSAHRNPVANVRTIVSANKNITIPNNELLRCKRKIHFISGQSYPGAQPASVARRNARERNRVKQVNNGFATLRSHIPPSVAAALTSEKSTPRNSSASKKLSKVETLKMAVEYIRSLQQMLEDHNNSLKDKIDAAAYDKQFEIDENYYSSSPETVSNGNIDPSHQYPSSPCRVFPKLEPLEPEYYPRNTRLPDDVYVKSENFNQQLHEQLTSEFYGARSPVKTYYIAHDDPHLNPDHPPIDYPLHDLPQPSPDPPKRRSPNLTVLNSVPANQTLHFPPHPFLQPHTRNPPSLSPTASDPCPSPTPSYSSDHSGLHPNSVLSASSGHLISSLSRLSTHPTPHPQPPSPPKCPTPPRNTTPLSAASTSAAPDPASPSNHSSYSAIDFHKGSPDYDNYDSVSPEDEELLDVISWWQQSH